MKNSGTELALDRIAGAVVPLDGVMTLQLSVNGWLFVFPGCKSHTPVGAVDALRAAVATLIDEAIEADRGGESD